MKKSRILFICMIIAMAFILSACAMGPRAVGTPGLAADDDMVYVSYQQFVYAVDTKSGTEVWRYPDKGNAQTMFYAPPEVEGDALFVGNLANNFLKLNKANGTVIWTFSESKGWFIGQALADGNVILAPNADRSLYALNSNGLLLWKFDNEHAFWAQPIVDTEVVFMGSMDHKVYALNYETGELRWETELQGAVVSAPVYDSENQMLYVGSIGKELVALSAIDGQIKWTYPKEGSIGSIWATPLLNEGQVIFSDETGKIFSLDAENGNLIWTLEAGGEVMAGLMPIESGFLVLLESGTIRAFDYERNPLWSRNVDGELYSKPVNANGVIVVAAIKSDSLLFGFDQSGNQLWSYKPGK